MCRLCDWGEIYPPSGADEAPPHAEAERRQRSQQLWAQLFADTDGPRKGDDGLEDRGA